MENYICYELSCVWFTFISSSLNCYLSIYPSDRCFSFINSSLTLTLHCSKNDDDATSTIRGGTKIDITNYKKMVVTSGTLYYGTSYTGYSYTCTAGNTYDISSRTGEYIFMALASSPDNNSVSTVTFTLTQ